MAAIEYGDPGLRSRGSPKCSIKAVILIRANCPTFRNSRGRPALKGKGQKGYERVVSGAIVA